MSEANKRENLLPLINKQENIICELTELCKLQQDLLSQHMSIDDLESRLKEITK